LAAAIFLCTTCAVNWTRAEPASTGSGRASTSRTARRSAIASIPFDQLSPNARGKVTDLLDDVSLFRRMPSQRIEVDKELYLFLVEHPDLVVNLWQIMGISDVDLARVDDARFRADDGAGTLADVEFLYCDPQLHILYAEGAYEGALFSKPVTGKCLLVLKSTYGRTRDGAATVTCRLDAFLQLEQMGAAVLARTFQPLVGHAADHNFRETALFMQRLNGAAATNQSFIHEIADQLADVPAEDRERFSELTDRVAVEAALAKSREAKQTNTSRPAKAAKKG
jgi:hypothetical protein